MHPTNYIFMGFGAILTLIGIYVFVKVGVKGQSSIKMFGMEFKLGGSALVIFVIGALLFLIPAIKPIPSKKENINSDTSKIKLNEPEITIQNTYEERIWYGAKSKNTLEAYEKYLSAYPGGKYKSEALQKYNHLKKPEKAINKYENTYVVLYHGDTLYLSWGVFNTESECRSKIEEKLKLGFWAIGELSVQPTPEFVWCIKYVDHDRGTDWEFYLTEINCEESLELHYWEDKLRREAGGFRRIKIGCRKLTISEALTMLTSH